MPEKKRTTDPERQKKSLRHAVEKLQLTSTSFGDDELDSMLRDVGTSDSDADSSNSSTDLSHSLALLESISAARPPRAAPSAAAAASAVGGSDARELQRQISALKEELRGKDRELQKLQHQYETDIAEHDEQIRDVVQQKRLVEMKAADDLVKAEKRYRDDQDRKAADMNALRTRQQEMEGRNVVLQQRMGDFREELRELVTSEAAYVQLKALPEEQLSLKEFVLLKVHELLQQEKSKADKLRKENASLVEKVEVTKDALERKSSEYKALTGTCDDRERQLTRDLELMQKKMSRLEAEFVEQGMLVDQMESKVQAYDATKARLDQLEREYASLENERFLQTAQLQQLGEERGELVARLNEKLQVAEMLQMDKLYLSKELEALRTKSQAQQERIDRQSRKKHELKQAKETLFSQLIKAREDQKTNYEQRLQVEVDRIRSETQRDLEQIRETNKQAFERESRSLREAKEAAVTEAEKLRGRLADAKRAYNELTDEHRKLQASLESKISELSSQLKMRTFEMERLAVTFEESAASLKQSNVTIDHLRSKIEVLTTEYYQLQTETARRITELEGQVADREDKLKTYEALEKDLDVALLTTGQEWENELSQTAALGTGGGGANVLAALTGTLSAVPSAPNRRIKQTLQLSRKIIEVQKHNQELSTLLELEKSKVAQLSEELRRTTGVLSQTQKPYNYLVANIQEREKALEQYQFVVDELEKQVRQLQQQNQLLEADVAELQQQNRQIDTLRQVIESLKGKLFDRRRDDSINISRPVDDRTLEPDALALVKPPESAPAAERSSSTSTWRNPSVSFAASGGPQSTVDNRTDSNFHIPANLRAGVFADRATRAPQPMSLGGSLPQPVAGNSNAASATVAMHAPSWYRKLKGAG